MNNNELHNILDNYKSFFDYAPIALWIEDLSEVKKYIENLTIPKDTSIEVFFKENPHLVFSLVNLIKIVDVNHASVLLYKAKNKNDLLGNLESVFTEKSIVGFSKLLIDLFSGKETSEVETVGKTLDGSEIDISIKFNTTSKGENERYKNVIISIINITERLKNKLKIAEVKQHYKQAQEIAKIATWYYDFKTNEIFWSDEAYKMVDLEPQMHQLSLEFYLSFIDRKDQSLAGNFSIKNLLENPNQKLNYKITTKNGDKKYIVERRSTVMEEDRIVKIIGICQDVTESILSEKKLSATKSLLSKTLAGINDGFVILDQDSNYVYVNEKAEKLLGKTASHLIGKNIWEEFPEKQGDLFYDSYYNAIRTNTPVSFENYYQPWDSWYENRIIPSHDGILMFFQEINERNSAENKIKEAYNIINKSSSVAILCKNDYNFPVVFASENIENLFGFPQEDFLSNKIKIHEVVYQLDLPYIRNEIFKIAKDKNSKGTKTEPFRIIAKNGKIKWVQPHIDIIKNDAGEITYIQGIVEDITDRKIAEDKFIESNQRLLDQFNNTPLASIIWDLDFRIIDWNKSAEKIFGYTKEEVVGTINPDLITPPHLKDDMVNLRTSLFLQRDGFKNRNQNITKNGELITCDWYSVTLKDADGNITGIASMADDVTESITSKILLEKSEKKYRDIFEKSIDAVLVLKDGVFIDCNAATLTIFGYENKRELLQIHPSEVSPEYQSDGSNSFGKAEEMIQNAVEVGYKRFRWLHKKKDGTIFPAEVTLTRISDKDSSLTVHAVVKNITERVKKEELETVLYNISKAANSLDDFKDFGLVIKNELNKIIDTSNFYIALYNKKENLLTTPFFADEKEPYVESFSAENTLTGLVIKSNKPLLITNKEHHKLVEKGMVGFVGVEAEIWLGVPLKNKDEVFGAIVVQSYTNKNAYNSNDVQLFEFVADQIGAAIQRKNYEQELNLALQKAKESDKLKSAFLANMSHEIRTPMNGIIGFSELYMDPNLPDAKRKKYAEIVINSSKRLLSIVNDILDISKIEAGIISLNNETVSLNKLIDDLYLFYSPMSKESKIDFDFLKGLDNNDCFITIDKTKLHQVLSNLLSNAFKFTNKGSIEFGYELINNQLQFFVKDTGIGISEELHDKIFERFIQDDATLNNKIKGTGLGLAISKKFIELFNGKIWFTTSNKGTSVFFTIPYKKIEQTSIITEQAPILSKETKLETKTILVAEDEEYNMLYVNELFSRTNYNLIEATNGEIAVNLAKQNPDIDLIFLDIKMPILDGYEALKKIKEFNKTTPVVALSAFAMESDKEKALEKGFDGYLSKPIDRIKFFNLIKELLDK